MTAQHTGDWKSCEACNEVREMMRAAISFDTKGKLLELLREYDRKYHQAQTPADFVHDWQRMRS